MFVVDRDASPAEGVRHSRSPEVWITATWLALVFATFVVRWLAGHGSDGGSSRPILDLSAIIVIAFVKIQLVMFVFMNVRSAPVKLRLIVSGWSACVCLGILVFVEGIR